MIYANQNDLMDKAHMFQMNKCPLLKGIYKEPIKQDENTYLLRKNDTIADKIKNKVLSYLGFPPYVQSITKRERSIECVASRSDSPILAIGFPDDSVHFYDIERECYLDLFLSHQQMKGITAIQYNPKDPNQIAIGCQYELIFYPST